MRLCIILLLTCAIAGCMGNVLDAFRATYPQAGPPIVIDDDGDGIADAYAADLNADGVPDRDEAGRVVEVPGSREAFADAGDVDEGISTLVATLAALGVPGVGLLSAAIGRYKPVQRAAALEAMFKGSVRSVQDVIAKAKTGALTANDIKTILAEANTLTVGLDEAVAAAKAAIKADPPS